MSHFLKILLILTISSQLLLVGCGSAKFAGSAPKAGGSTPVAAPETPREEPEPEAPVQPPPSPEPAKAPLPTETAVDLAAAVPIDCSTTYQVPGTANPYFALVEPGVEISYVVGESDNSSTEPPVEVAFTDPRCLAVGSRLSFVVGGKIKHGPTLPETDPDGALNETFPHEGGASLGKSHIVAPLNSLVGVFLGNALPNVAPEALRFETNESRDYAELKPSLGQIFFIGDGKTAAGSRQSVIVPEGAAHFFFGIMDSYGWYNNDGALEGSVQWQAK